MTKIGSLRDIPQVDEFIELDEMRKLQSLYGHTPVVEASRTCIENLRQKLLQGSETETLAFLQSAVIDHLKQNQSPKLRRVINATGTILHTNLGRAPLARAAVDAVCEIVSGYSNLEYNLDLGKRGYRTSFIEERMQNIFGVETAVVVNNNAAGVMLALAALSRDKEVIVSRGELVEIGGSFRIPEVMSESGAKLIEVGTTNKTHLKDYRNAINDETGALLKVHRSNFLIEGFTSEVSVEDLQVLAGESNLPLIYDLGSGSFADELTSVLPDEPTIKQALNAKVDLILCSGDKLFGGPQAGLILGRADLIAKIKQHPLMRPLRVDKMTLAALEATLILYSDADKARENIPLLQMTLIDMDNLKTRSSSLIKNLKAHGIDATLEKSFAVLGGGSTPGVKLDSYNVVVTPAPGQSAQQIDASLHQADPPVIPRILRNRVHFDLRTVKPGEDKELSNTLIATLKKDEI
ncbi:MAG: L-seryl-tRNA(Sec) selenium transferase [Fastidiosipila sp.]|nr:L-seryl-tRNA(Sec) selenium transferase [Fastidiosipila sp.]